LPSPSSKPVFSQVAVRAFNDLFIRYKTMRGYHVLRRSGWQAHGLTVVLMAYASALHFGQKPVEEFGIANSTRRTQYFNYYDP
jgi:isoleucyl-tRNA synthetase